MSNISLEIFKDSKYNSSFLKCNSYIIKKNIEQFKALTCNTDKFSLLENLWKNQLNIELTPTGSWQKLVFNSEKDKTFFLLKWQR